MDISFRAFLGFVRDLIRILPLYILMPLLAFNSYVLGMTIGPFLSYPRRFKLIIGTFCHGTMWICKHLLKIDVELQGKENLPNDGKGYVIMSKHQSPWETLYLQTVFDPNTVVIKQEAFYIPFFGWGIALLNPIFVNRSKGKQATEELLIKGSERLQKGEDILIFPEGTRVPVGEHKSFKKGGALLACEAGASIIPVAHNSGEHWINKRWFKRPGTIKVAIGPTINTKGKTWQQVNAEAEAWIFSKTDEISRLDQQTDLTLATPNSGLDAQDFMAHAVRTGKEWLQQFWR